MPEVGGLIGNLDELLPWIDCTKCGLCKTAHKHVLGRGPLPCDVLFIGEGPGMSEDTLGAAFLGRAGRLLTKAIGPWVDKLVLAYTNLVACRPCDGEQEPNRAPRTDEMDACEPRLLQTVKMARPRGLVILGRVPEGRDLPRKLADSMPRPPRHLLLLAHPAALLRRGGEQAPGWPIYQGRLQAFLKDVAR